MQRLRHFYVTVTGRNEYVNTGGGARRQKKEEIKRERKRYRKAGRYEDRKKGRQEAMKT